MEIKARKYSSHQQLTPCEFKNLFIRKSDERYLYASKLQPLVVKGSQCLDEREPLDSSKTRTVLGHIPGMTEDGFLPTNDDIVFR